MLSSISRYFHNRFRDNEARLHELNYLFWECTRRCNLACLHCGSDCKADAGVKDMPFEDFLNAILPLREKYNPNTITVVITGGEPLLRKDLSQCGKILREHGFRWGIVTNGLAYNADTHARLLAAGLGAVTLSLDGLEGAHCWLRHSSISFGNALRALDLVASADRLFYDVVTCVNTKNIAELPALKQLLVSRKAKAWRLFTIAPTGRAAGNHGLQLSGKQLEQLMDFIAQCRTDRRIDVKFSCEAYVGRYERKVRDSYFFCRAGINIASVLIDGSISACPNINRHFVQGNIYSDSLLDVWENRFDAMRNRSWTKTGICLNCKDYRYCNGGAMHLWNEKQDCVITCINDRMKQPTGAIK